MGEELPYHLTVTIEHFKCDGNLIDISALIWVSSEGQKAIVIGKNGEILKQIGEQVVEHQRPDVVAAALEIASDSLRFDELQIG